MLFWIALVLLALVLFEVGFFTMPIVFAAVAPAVAVSGGGHSRYGRH